MHTKNTKLGDGATENPSPYQYEFINSEELALRWNLQNRGFASKCVHAPQIPFLTFDLGNMYGFAGAVRNWKIGPSGV
jgi:hypothetical protein